MTPPSTLYALFAIFQSRYDVVHLLIGIGLIGIGLIALATIITLATRKSALHLDYLDYRDGMKLKPLT